MQPVTYQGTDIGAILRIDGRWEAWLLTADGRGYTPVPGGHPTPWDARQALIAAHLAR